MSRVHLDHRENTRSRVSVESSSGSQRKHKVKSQCREFIWITEKTQGQESVSRVHLDHRENTRSRVSVESSSGSQRKHKVKSQCREFIWITGENTGRSRVSVESSSGSQRKHKVKSQCREFIWMTEQTLDNGVQSTLDNRENTRSRVSVES